MACRKGEQTEVCTSLGFRNHERLFRNQGLSRLLLGQSHTIFRLRTKSSHSAVYNKESAYPIVNRQTAPRPESDSMGSRSLWSTPCSIRVLVDQCCGTLRSAEGFS